MPAPVAARLHARLVAARNRPAPVGDPSCDALRARVLEVIAAEASNPHLTPGDVAAALRIGDRTLAQLFEHEPTGVAELIAQARLDLALQHLEDTRLSRDLAVVAQRSGYASVADLDRAVRTATGHSPRGQEHTTPDDEAPEPADAPSTYRPTLPRGRRARDILSLLR